MYRRSGRCRRPRRTRKKQGAMTKSLLVAYKEMCRSTSSSSTITYADLLDAIHVQLRQKGFPQKPQMTSSQRFDARTRVFSISSGSSSPTKMNRSEGKRPDTSDQADRPIEPETVGSMTYLSGPPSEPLYSGRSERPCFNLKKISFSPVWREREPNQYRGPSSPPSCSPTMTTGTKLV